MKCWNFPVGLTCYLTCYLLWSSGLYSPTRLLALPRPLAGGQGHLVNGLRYVFFNFFTVYTEYNVPLLAAYYTDDSGADHCFQVKTIIPNWRLVCLIESCCFPQEARNVLIPGYSQYIQPSPTRSYCTTAVYFT